LAFNYFFSGKELIGKVKGEIFPHIDMLVLSLLCYLLLLKKFDGFSRIICGCEESWCKLEKLSF